MIDYRKTDESNVFKLADYRYHSYKYDHLILITMSVETQRRVSSLDADSSDDDSVPASTRPLADDSSDSSIGRPDDMDRVGGSNDEAISKRQARMNADSSDEEVKKRSGPLSADSSDEEPADGEENQLVSVSAENFFFACMNVLSKCLNWPWILLQDQHSVL